MELLKLLLVDDEMIILKGLEVTYDWQSMGFEIVGTANDGDEALSKIKCLQPDVVLTDIRMKRMDGLTLMEKAKEINDNIKFIVISAFKDFEYAQNALRNGALGYLVKPINDDELHEVMTEIYDRCIENRSTKQQFDKWRQLLVHGRDSYLHMMLGRFINRGISAEKIKQIYKELNGEDFPNNQYIVICADVDVSYKILKSSDYDAKRYVLLSELERQLSEHYLIHTYPRNDTGTIFVVDLGQSKKTVEVRHILSNISLELDCNIISAMSNVVVGLDGIIEGYNQAIKLYEIAAEAGADMLSVPDQLDTKINSAYSIDIENQIISSMRKNDEEMLKENYIQFVYHLPKDEHQQVMYIHRLIVRAEFWIRSTDECMILADEFSNFYQLLLKYQSTKLVDLAYKLLQNLLRERQKQIPDNAGGLFNDYMKTAEIFIEEHLHEEELSISQVAAQIYLNPVYFGRVFKSYFGVSFKRYVLNARMERAKMLILDTETSIAGICMEVGIPNPSYFTKLFKQCTGQLPSDYKRNVVNE